MQNLNQSDYLTILFVIFCNVAILPLVILSIFREMPMSNRTIPSSLQIADWFYKKASADGTLLNETKVQHLLFLTQIHFILKHGRFLYPSLFICSETGFYNPTIRTLLDFGLPLLPTAKFSNETENFLNIIWQKYAHQTEKQLTSFILSLECWKRFHHPSQEIIVNPMMLIDSFAETIHKSAKKPVATSKIMISQNGPVKVSSWQPRKLSSSNK